MPSVGKEVLRLIVQWNMSIPEAAREAHLSAQAIYHHRDRCPQFRRALEKAIEQRDRSLATTPTQPAVASRVLDHLAEGMTAGEATKAVGVSVATTLRWRRKSLTYASKWEAAVAQGLKHKTTTRGKPAQRADAGVRRKVRA